MNKQSLAIFISVTLLCLFTATFLQHIQSGHRLGKPGLALESHSLTNSKGEVVGTNVVALPERVLDYNSERMAITDLEFTVLPRDTTFGKRRYIAPDGFFVDVNAILMGTDRTSIHKPEFCLDGQGWRIVKSELRNVHVSSPIAYDLPVMTLTAMKRSRLTDGRIVDLKGVYSYWFVCENRLTAKHGERMWWLARDLLFTGTLPRWAYVSCFGTCYPGQEDATFERIQQFIAAAVPEFQLPSAALSRAASIGPSTGTVAVAP